MGEGNRVVVFVSDMHVGSIWGWCPPDEDTIERAAWFRDWVRVQWADFCDWTRDTFGTGVITVVNGDAMEGIHHGGRELTASSWTKQTRWAAMMLAPLATGPIYFVRGTECHTWDDEDELGVQLEAQGLNVIRAKNSITHDTARFEVNGLMHWARHHSGVPGRRWTAEGAVANHMADTRLEAVNCGQRPPDVLAVAHGHQYSVAQGQCGGMALRTPSWKGIDRHTQKASRAEVPCVGGVVLDYRNCGPKEFAHVRTFIKYLPESQR
jgi:hypothetical protein